MKTQERKKIIITSWFKILVGAPKVNTKQSDETVTIILFK